MFTQRGGNLVILVQPSATLPTKLKFFYQFLACQKQNHRNSILKHFDDLMTRSKDRSQSRLTFHTERDTKYLPFVR